MKSSLRRGIAVFAFSTLCIGAAFVCRRHAPMPFVWAYAFFGIGVSALLFMAKSDIIKYTGIIILSLFLALSGGEFFLSPSPQTNDAGETLPSFRKFSENGKGTIWTTKDPLTGYRGKSSAHVRAHSVQEGQTIYDVVYSTNKDGWRAMPQHDGARIAVVFFGCSYTFGEALDDEDTFAIKLSGLLGPEYQVFNFGFSGFGSHQFLALLESGVLAPITSNYEKVHIFYLSLAGHELRSGGYSDWDTWGPWYEEENGRAVHKGNFADREGRFRSAMNYFFRKSHVYSLLFNQARATEAEGPLRQLQAVIIQTAAEKIAGYENTDFTLLSWPGNEAIAKDMEACAVNVTPLAPALPGYENDAAQYQIKGDGHPNARANSLVADFLADIIHELDQPAAAPLE